MFKFFYVMGKVLSGELFCPCDRSCVNSMSLYFALETVENNKYMKSVKFQGNMLNFYDFIQVFVSTTNHYLK